MKNRVLASIYASLVAVVAGLLWSIPPSPLVSHVHAQTVVPLAPVASCTKTAATGNWGTAGTWTPSGVPGADDKVCVPAGVTVTVDGEFTAAVFWVRVDGTLKHAPSVATKLTLDSLFVMSGGLYEMGTSVAPITATAKLVIQARNDQPIDVVWDYAELSRGLVVESGGLFVSHGAAKTGWVNVSTIPQLGSSQVVVDTLPSGWNVGDQVVFTSSEFDTEETRTITAINGQTVTVNSAWLTRRAFPAGCAGYPCKLQVANLTRNARIETAAANAGSKTLQGHVMLMHTGGHSVKYTGFYNLGRTTIDGVTDPKLVEGVRVVDLAPTCGLTFENTRGRYALHFHRAGPAGALSVVDGAVVQNVRNSRFKFGYINHSSKVNISNSVAFNIDGSQYMTEEGDETGVWLNNLAIHSKGKHNSGLDHQPDDACVDINYPVLAEERRLDTGFKGSGFWLQGGGVDVDGNTAAGMSDSGFDTWTRELNFNRTNTYDVKFVVALHRSGGAWAAPLTEVAIEHPPSLTKNGQAYGSWKDETNQGGRYFQKSCFSFKYHGLSAVGDFPGIPRSIMQDMLGWNCRVGIQTAYTDNVLYDGVVLIQGDLTDVRNPGKGAALAAQNGGHHTDLVDVSIHGFQTCIAHPVETTFSNVTCDGVPYP